MRGDRSKIFGSAEDQSGVDPDIGQTVKLNWKQGSQAVLSSLGNDGAFTDATLSTVAADLGDSHAVNADADKGFLNVIQLMRLNNGFDLLHF